MSPTLQCQLETNFVDGTLESSSPSSSAVSAQGGGDALQLLEAAAGALAELSKPLPEPSDQKTSSCCKQCPLPCFKKHPVAPTQEKTVPSLKKKKAILRPLSTGPALSFSSVSHKKGILDPLSAGKGLPSPKKKKITLEPLFAGQGLSCSSQSPKETSTSFEKSIVEPFSACPISKPCQEKAVPSLKKKNSKLEPISGSCVTGCPSLAACTLQKSPSLPSFKGISPLSVDSSEQQRPQTVPADQTRRQQALGAQSLRGGGMRSDPFHMLNGNVHAKTCFQDLLMTEEKMCAEWAVFYHSYSTSALIYEVQAAIAAVLFGFRSQNGTLPRLLVNDFVKFPHAAALRNSFKGLNPSKESDECHDGREEYMAVGLSAMCSLLAYGPEASPTKDFCRGYADSAVGASWDPDLAEALSKLFRKCSVGPFKTKKLMLDIIALSEKHGLDVSLFNGQECQSKQPGHLLQICMRRDVVDKLAYASLPYGHADESRPSMSHFMDGNNSFDYGQARILARPEYFLEPDAVRCHVVSADPKFHASRQAFQMELTELLSTILGDAASRETAARGIFGGSLPEGWTTDEHQSVRFSKPTPGARHLIKV